MSTKLSMRVGVMAVAAALLAACGSDGSGGSDSGQAADTESPQAGGSMRIVQLVEPRTLDPADLGNLATTGALVGNSLYGQLLEVDEDGAIEYGLAQDVSTSDGGTTWKLTLRDGLTFTDGTPLDAAAVQFNWARLADPSLGSTSRGYAAFVQSMTPSGQTLDFTLSQPIAQFATTIASQSLNWIASPQALQAGRAEFDAHPSGAGPFVLESWQRNGELVLARNDDYYDSPRPYLDELVLTVNNDANQRLSTLTSGGADAIISSNPDQRAIAEDQGYDSVTQDLGDSIALAMNTRIAPFDDVRARQAVYLGVDRDALNAAVYMGDGSVPQALFADDSPSNGDATLPAYDPEAAQQLFDELAADGHPVEFTINSLPTTQNRQVAENIQAQLNQYDNVKVEVQVLDQPANLAQYTQRTFQVSSTLLRANPVDLYTALSSDSQGNATGVSDPELDAALLAALGASDEDERTQAYQDIAERYSELVPNLNYVRTDYALIYADQVHGAEMYGTSSIPTDVLWTSK